MDVPVVAAAGLERHVVDADLIGGKGREVALPDKVLRKCVVGGADRKGHLVLVLSSCISSIAIRPDLLRHAKGRPRLGPSCVKRRMCKDFRYLRPGHAIVLCGHQMILERRVRQALRHQGHHRHDATVPQGELALSAPHLAEQHIVVELCEFGGELPQGISTRRLLNCHDRFPPIDGSGHESVSARPSSPPRFPCPFVAPTLERDARRYRPHRSRRRRIPFCPLRTTPCATDLY